MEDIKNQLATKIKEANNVLVTVTSSPSVDQLSSAIALTLMLNKLNKHATAVFSGAIPSTIEFLEPEKTIEKNTDSLRDFIISLDKAKADKLRYKIEDQFVKIFITPYHTSISDKDLVFSQGDFNVDLVVGLGVHQREELDEAITSHGRILHDATVVTINTDPPSDIGGINFADKDNSSLCEILTDLATLLSKDSLLDEQVANALLTGIVSETQRFSNQKTSSRTMAASSKLLAAGANQQLVAKELTPDEEEPEEVKADVPKPAPTPPPVAPTPVPVPVPPKPDVGTLQIDHAPKPQPDDAEHMSQVVIDDQGTLKTFKDDLPESGNTPPTTSDTSTQPPAGPPQPGTAHSFMSGSTSGLPTPTPSANPDEAGSDQNNSGQSLPQPMLSHGAPLVPPSSMDSSNHMVIQPPPQPSLQIPVPEPTPVPPALSDPVTPAPSDINQARDAVNAAIASNPVQPYQPPDQALNAMPVELNPPQPGLDSTIDPSLPFPNPSTSPPPVPPPILPPDMTAL